MATDDYILPGWDGSIPEASYQNEDMLSNLTGINNSLVRPEDEDQHEFGGINGFRNQGLRLQGQAEASEKTAMEYLRASMNKQAEISPAQGIGSALLAAIPTLGGYMIGKSVGRPDVGFVPGFDVTKYKTGAYEGGLAGAALGDQTSQNYFKALQANQDQKNEVYTKMAQAELNKAQRLQSQAAQLEMAGLNAENQESLLDKRMGQDQKMLLARGQQAIEMERQMQKEGLGRYADTKKGNEYFDMMSPAQRAAYIAKQTGVDAEGKPIGKGVGFEIPAAAREKVAENYAFIEEASDLAAEISKFPSWGAYQKTALAAGLDPTAIQSRMLNLRDRLARARTGAVINKDEDETFKKMLVGDFSASPQQIGNILNKLVDSEKRMTLHKIDVYQRANDAEGLRDLFTSPPTPGQMKKQFDPNDPGFLAFKKKKYGG